MLDRSRREINIGPAVSRDRRHREMEAGPVFHATVWCGESPGEPLPSPCLGLLADSHTVRAGRNPTVQYCNEAQDHVVVPRAWELVVS